MSGGVDSSVVAGLLKASGYDVVGMTLQLYDHGEATHRKGACCAGQDIQDARQVAETLGIPHYTLDYEERFKNAVIDRFADSYAAGETPVPCITCNQTVKFADLLETARQLGADALATGHYVRSEVHGTGRALFRPADLERDHPHVRSIMANALKNVRPSHLLDRDVARAWAERADDIRPSAPTAPRPAHAAALPVARGGKLHLPIVADEV